MPASPKPQRMDQKVNKPPDRSSEEQRLASESASNRNSGGHTSAESPAPADDAESVEVSPMAAEAVAAEAVSRGAGSDPKRRTAWDRVQFARHPQRPHTLDYIQRIFTGFEEIHGDRSFGDDPAIVCGMATFDGEPVVVIGQQKGRDTKQKLYRNFGMPKPEGYRKALRVMKFAEKFGRPIVTLLDTPGAYPGIDAEERGQAEAIARNLFSMAQIRTPILVTCIGEGGSGGALALGVGNRVLMLENAVYSVISPESCAAIVWRDSSKAELAAEALKLTAEDLLKLGLIDEIIPEPPQGAHEDYDAAATLLAAALSANLQAVKNLSATELMDQRYRKFRVMGNFFSESP